MIKETNAYITECECHEEHPELIERGKTALPETTDLYDLSDFFKVLGDSTRLGILFAIDGAPMCVCDIAGVLGMTKSAVSHQLKVLRQNRLVKYSKIGKNVFYELSDDHVRDIIEKALDHIGE
jgi:ArsR family transcriptional regulator